MDIGEGLDRSGLTAVWEWPDAEPPAPVPLPSMVFSASRLNMLADCPRRFFFTYLAGVVDDEGSMQATYGKCFHAALERFHSRVRRVARADVDAAALTGSLQDELDVAFAEAAGHFASPLEAEVSRRRAHAVGARYVQWLIDEWAQSDVEVLDLERVHRVVRGGHSFVGFIDRVDRPIGGGPVIIFDYKTGKIAEDAAQYAADVRGGREPQLALYYAMRRALGEEVARIALVSLRDARAPVWTLNIDIKSEPDVSGTTATTTTRMTALELEEALDELVARCTALYAGGHAHFPAGEDPPCGYCAYRAACREEPYGESRIFAR